MEGISPEPGSSHSAGYMFKIIAAVDRSRYASVVMETVAKVTSHVESDVTILTVIKSRRYLSTDSSTENEKTVGEFHKDLMHKYFPQNLLALDSKSNRGPKLIPTQSATVRSKVVEGDPADEICSMADRLNADLVVVGKRGGGNVGAMLLGSVSEKVVHKCARSVLVAKLENVDDAGWVQSTHEVGRKPHSSSQ